MTSRNTLTLPCSVPIIRHPPPTERFLRVTSPTKLIGDDHRAEKRNADQIVYQTSGEIGRFYIDPESQGAKLGKKPLQPIRRTLEPKFNLGMSFPEPTRSTPQLQDSQPAASQRSPASSRLNTERLLTGRDTERGATHDSFASSSQRGPMDSSQYLATLKQLDRTFSNTSRRDLFAASMPSRPPQELVWCAANNNKGAQASKSWAERLRRDHPS